MEIYQQHSFTKQITNYLLWLTVLLFLLQIAVAIFSNPDQEILSLLSEENEFSELFRDMDDLLSSSGFFSIEQIAFHSGTVQLLKLGNLVNEIIPATDGIKSSLLSGLLRVLFFTIVFIKFNFLALIAGLFIARPLIKTYKGYNFFGLTKENSIFDYNANISEEALQSAGLRLPSTLFLNRLYSVKVQRSAIWKSIKGWGLDSPLNAYLLSIILSHAERLDLNLLETLLKACFGKVYNSPRSELKRTVEKIKPASFNPELLSSFILAIVAAHSVLFRNNLHAFDRSRLFLFARDLINTSTRSSNEVMLNRLRSCLSSCVNQETQISTIEQAGISAFAKLICRYINGLELEVESILRNFELSSLLSNFAVELAAACKGSQANQLGPVYSSQNLIAVRLEQLVNFFSNQFQTDFKSLNTYFAELQKSVSPDQQIEARQESYLHNIPYDSVLFWSACRQLLLSYGCCNAELCLFIKFVDSKETALQSGNVVFDSRIISQILSSKDYSPQVCKQFVVYRQAASAQQKLNPYFIAH